MAYRHVFIAHMGGSCELHRTHPYSSDPMPQHFAEAEFGFEVGGILGLNADSEIRFDGVGLRSLFIEWLNSHPCERPGGGEKTHSGAIVSVRFTDQFLYGPKG